MIFYYARICHCGEFQDPQPQDVQGKRDRMSFSLIVPMLNRYTI